MGENISTRVAYGKALAEFGTDEKLFVFDADLKKCTMTLYFAEKYPERFFNIGIAEANMVDIAAGFATCGATALVHTFAIFATGRTYDQIRNSVCYPGLNVKIVGSHGGLTVGEDGATHQALEDISLMRGIPGMTVIIPCDSYEARLATKAMLEKKGPCYFRTCRPAVECVSDQFKNYNFEIGKGVQLTEGTDVIADDIQGLINIGINVSIKNQTYKIMDNIIGLDIPNSVRSEMSSKSEISVIKDNIRKRLNHINHKYLVLIDLGFDGTADRDYELQTADLLTSELSFKGARLGDTRKPDVCVYHGTNGLIIDNKAYGKGYSLPIKQADEMLRYIEENQKRDKSLNPNEWWTIFDDAVSKFNFAFVSGEFTGGFKDRLENISRRSSVNGAAINSVNLLLLAEEIKSGRMSYSDAFKNFDCNKEITI